MQLFQRLYTSDHNRHDDDKPPKRGLARFFEIVFHEFWQLIHLNVVFLLFCIPVVTIGPAVAGMTAVLTSMVRDQPRMLFAKFWDTLKRELKRSLQLALIGALAFGIVICAAFAALRFLPPLVCYMVLPALFLVLVFLSMTWLYVFPLSVNTMLSVRHVLRNARLLAVICARHALPAVFLCGIICAVTLLYFPFSLPFLLFIVPAFCGLIGTFAAWAGIRDHVVGEALAKPQPSLLEDADEWAAIWKS